MLNQHRDSALPEIQQFVFDKNFSICCVSLMSFQSLEGVAFGSCDPFIIAFMGEDMPSSYGIPEVRLIHSCIFGC